MPRANAAAQVNLARLLNPTFCHRAFHVPAPSKHLRSGGVRFERSVHPQCGDDILRARNARFPRQRKLTRIIAQPACPGGRRH
jgi:hypothetical protein